MTLNLLFGKDFELILFCTLPAEPHLTLLSLYITYMHSSRLLEREPMLGTCHTIVIAITEVGIDHLHFTDLEMEP